MSDQRIEKYAAWIAENADKKGSPEFETVADAYRQLRGGNEYGMQQPTALESVGRGFADVYQGVQQIFRGDEYDQKVADEMRLYDKYAGDGFDLGRVAGQAAALVPMAATAAYLGVPAAASAVGVPGWASAAGAGALEGSLLSVGEGGSRTANTLMGGAGGAAGYGVFSALSRAGQAAINAARRARATSGSIANIEQLAIDAARAAGVPLESIDDELKRAFMRDVRKAVASNVDDAGGAVRRKAILEAEGLTPTAGRVLRDPMQFSDEENLRKLTGIGDELQSIREKNLSRLHGRYSEIADEAGEGVSSYSAGEDLIGAVKRKDTYLNDLENQAYRSARESIGGDAYVPHENLQATMEDLLGTFDKREIGETITDRLSQYIDDADTLTVDTAEREIQRLNEIIRSPANAQQRMAATRLKHAIQDDLGDVGQEGSEAARLYRKARRISRQRRSLRESQASKRPEILGKLLDNSASADDAVRLAKNAKTRELGALIKYLRTGPDEIKEAGNKALSQLRRSVLDEFYKKAAPNLDEGGFSGKRFQDEIRKFGPEKLAALFPGQADKIKRFAEAAVIETYAPPLDKINRSNSGSFLADMLARAMDIPGVNMISQPVAGLYRSGAEAFTEAAQRAQARQASNALMSSPAAINAAKEAADQFRRLYAPAAGAVGGIAATNAQQ